MWKHGSSENEFVIEVILIITEFSSKENKNETKKVMSYEYFKNSLKVGGWLIS